MNPQAERLRGFLLLESPLDRKLARQRYYAQRKNAKQRGIGWELTFQQWLDWWGEDLDRRGSRVDCLQMQRFADAGPYKLGNIQKGTPKQNGRTYSNALQNRKAEVAAAMHQAALDTMPVGDGEDPDPEDVSISEYFSRDRANGREFDWNPARISLRVRVR